MPEFDVSSMKEGDTFVGCRVCGHKVESGTLPPSECPACAIPSMSIYKVTEGNTAEESQKWPT